MLATTVKTGVPRESGPSDKGRRIRYFVVGVRFMASGKKSVIAGHLRDALPIGLAWVQNPGISSHRLPVLAILSPSEVATVSS